MGARAWGSPIASLQRMLQGRTYVAACIDMHHMPLPARCSGRLAGFAHTTHTTQLPRHFVPTSVLKPPHCMHKLC